MVIDNVQYGYKVGQWIHEGGIQWIIKEASYIPFDVCKSVILELADLNTTLLFPTQVINSSITWETTWPPRKEACTSWDIPCHMASSTSGTTCSCCGNMLSRYSRYHPASAPYFSLRPTWTRPSTGRKCLRSFSRSFRSLPYSLQYKESSHCKRYIIQFRYW